MKKLDNKHLKLCALRLVVRTSGFHPGNRGSIPLGRTNNLFYYGRLAQLGEHLPYKQGVTGSSPVATTIIFLGV